MNSGKIVDRKPSIPSINEKINSRHKHYAPSPVNHFESHEKVHKSRPSLMQALSLFPSDEGKNVDLEASLD